MRPTSGDFTLTAFQPIVVEPSPVRGLAADRPYIQIVFIHSRLRMFHRYVVVIVFRIFQQFKGIHYILSDYNGLCAHCALNHFYIPFFFT